MKNLYFPSAPDEKKEKNRTGLINFFIFLQHEKNNISVIPLWIL